MQIKKGGSSKIVLMSKLVTDGVCQILLKLVMDGVCQILLKRKHTAIVVSILIAAIVVSILIAAIVAMIQGCLMCYS